LADSVGEGYADAPAIEHGGQQAFYHPAWIWSKLPEPSRVASNEEYYSTLFMSLLIPAIANAGSEAGGELMPFGSADYGKEELIAEMASAFPCGHTGITPP